MKRLAWLAILGGCSTPRAQDIPTEKMNATFVEVRTLKAPVHATIHGFEKSGGFDAQVVWRAPADLRVRCSHFEFACGGGRFQLWIPDDKKFIHGKLDEFRKSEKGVLITLFEGVLPRKPAFTAFGGLEGYFYGIAADSVVRFRGTTPVDRHGAVHVKYEEVHEGIPVQVIARTDGKALHIAIAKEKMKVDTTVPDHLFEMSPPEGAIVEEYRP